MLYVIRLEKNYSLERHPLALMLRSRGFLCSKYTISVIIWPAAKKTGNLPGIEDIKIVSVEMVWEEDFDGYPGSAFSRTTTKAHVKLKERSLVIRSDESACGVTFLRVIRLAILNRAHSLTVCFDHAKPSSVQPIKQ